jgi:hypothetical protein
MRNQPNKQTGTQSNTVRNPGVASKDVKTAEKKADTGKTVRSNISLN